MTYAIIMSVPDRFTGRQINQTAALHMEVLDFDGENYTIRIIYIIHRIDQEAETPQSFTVKVSKHGHEIEGLPKEFQDFYTAILVNLVSGAFTDIPGLWGGFPKPMAAVGEGIWLPFALNRSGEHITGTVNLRFSELATKTLANIGELKVFKVDFSVLDLQVAYQGTRVHMGVINGYGYYEHGTCLLVEYFVQEYLGQDNPLYINLQINLKKHNKP